MAPALAPASASALPPPLLHEPPKPASHQEGPQEELLQEEKGCTSTHSVPAERATLFPLPPGPSHARSERVAVAAPAEGSAARRKTRHGVICAECGKQFSSNAHLDRHRRVHTGEKPYQCAKCGKQFSSNAALQQHRRVHTGEKPYPCAECGKCFSLSSTLRSHRTTHTGEKPFCCPGCDRAYSDRSGRRRHLQHNPYCRAVAERMTEAPLIGKSSLR